MFKTMELRFLLVLDFEYLSFDIVSDFVLRISDFYKGYCVLVPLWL